MSARSNRSRGLRSVSLRAFASGAVLSAFALPVGAQDRPSEADMFGGPAPATDPAAVTPADADADGGVALPLDEQSGPSGAASGTIEQAGATSPAASAAATRDEAVLGGGSTPMFSEPAAPADPLSIGGQIYLRAQASGNEHTSVEDYGFNMPSLLDVYFDARPNDRVRGFVLGRMSYDPTVSSNASPLTAADPIGGSAALSSVFGPPRSGDPRVVLDQLWLRFDIEHSVFVTAGKQHVRWGTARFWSPADFLHLRRRNPLDVFDARTGTTMLKLHVPIESNSWNFYGYIVPEGPDGTAALANIAGALRAELVFGQTELGLGAFARKGSKAKLAADVSSGVGDFDVYAEAALRSRDDVDRVRFEPDADVPDAITPLPGQSAQDVFGARLQQFVDARYPVVRESGYRPQVAAGLSYTRKYNDNDTFTLGAEYFFNPLGYSSSDVYAGLLAPRAEALRDPATFFYLGKHYAAVFIAFPAPLSLDLHTFSMSTLGNLSDRSFISRLDYSLLVLTHLRFEAFVALHYGRSSGEFRFGLSGIDFEGFSLERPPGLIDLGVALRLSI